MRFVRRPPPPPPEPLPPDNLEPIAIFRAEGVAEAATPRHTGRLSDELNARLPVRVLEDGAWSELDTWGAIAIAVEPNPEPSPNRVTRRRHVLDLSAPPYRLSGVAHMPPGADPTRYAAAASQRWLALTDASVLNEDGSGFEVDVLLVNMDWVARR